MSTRWLRLLGASLLVFGGHAAAAGVGGKPDLLSYSRQQIPHPAGPIIRDEWRLASDKSPQVVSIQRLYSGTPILDGVRLTSKDGSDWCLINRDGSATGNCVNTQSPALFFRALGYAWMLYFVSGAKPKAASEEEWSAHILVYRLAAPNSRLAAP